MTSIIANQQMMIQITRIICNESKRKRKYTLIGMMELATTAVSAGNDYPSVCLEGIQVLHKYIFEETETILYIKTQFDI